MHIAGHTLRADVAIATAAISTPLIVWAAAKARKDSSKAIPALCASLLVLGFQSINLPISGGTSAHLLGATLLAALFGPYWGTLGIAAVYSVQGLLLGDGGVDALGANILNGGLIGTFLGFALYRSLRRENASLLNKNLSLFVASVSAFLLGALACSSELAISGVSSFTSIAEHMMSGSLAWAFLEGGLTLAIANLYWTSEKRGIQVKNLALPLAAAGVLGWGIHPWVSSEKPDHLEAFLMKDTAEGR